MPDLPNAAALETAANPEPERQGAELAAMRRLLALSSGTFSFSVAICNSPALRDYLIQKLAEEEPRIAVAELPEKAGGIFNFVKGRVSPDAAAIFITNLEKSVSSDAALHPALGRLNASRELWPSLKRPVVFWLPEYAATILSKEARDFWSWVSHRFEFVAEKAGEPQYAADRYSGDLTLASNLEADQKRFRIAELEERVKEAGGAPPPALARFVPVWLFELGFLYSAIGDLDKAEEMHRKALEIDKKLGLQGGMAADYGNLGLIYLRRGDLDKAEEMHRNALAINERLGRLEGMAKQYNNLGVIYQTRGDLDKAEEMHCNALAINERLGRLEGMAAVYGNLGVTYMMRGDSDKAEEMHRKALEIDEKLGRREGMANDYGNLGLIYQTRGDFDKAEEMYRKALKILVKLGLREGMAKTYGNLSVMYKMLGDPDKAEEMHRKVLLYHTLDGGGSGMMNPADVALQLGISTETVIRLIKKGKLPGFKIGRKWFIRREVYESYLRDFENALKS